MQNDEVVRLVEVSGSPRPGLGFVGGCVLVVKLACPLRVLESSL